MLRRDFTKGRMNKDVDERLLPPGEYRHAENVIITEGEGGDSAAVKNPFSTKQLTDFDFGTNAKAISFVVDQYNNQIIWFVVSDSGSYIALWNKDLNLYSTILEDTRVGDLNVLGFSENELITGINVIVDSDTGTTFLAWTCMLRGPRLINIERAMSWTTNDFDSADISLIKAPPIFPPSIVLSQSDTIDENNLSERFLRFSYRYQYLDGEYSAISPFTETAFLPKTFDYRYNTATNEGMINKFNQVEISFNVGSRNVKNVQILFKESGSSNVYVVHKYKKENENWDDNELITIDFKNNKVYKVLDDNQLGRMFDNVPRFARSQGNIGNRLMFGNYVENYNISDCYGKEIPIVVSTELLVGNVPTVQKNSIKSNRDYEIGLVYVDEYGRCTTVLDSENNDIHVPIENSVTENKFKISIFNKAPCFAKYFRFFIKQNKVDYDIIAPAVFYFESRYVWIRLEGGDKDKVKEGDYLIVKSDTDGFLDYEKKIKVLRAEFKEKNFLQPDDVSNKIEEKDGFYIKILVDDWDLDVGDFENFYLSTYHNSRSKYTGPLQNLSARIYPAVFYGNGDLDDMTVGGVVDLNNGEDRRFVVKISEIATSGTGTVVLTGGTSGSVDGITVDGIEIMSGSESFESDLDTTAFNIALNISSNTSTPNYTATSSGSTITITSNETGEEVNGLVVLASPTSITTSTTNMSGAINDSFQWSDDNGISFSSDVNISTTAQILSSGATITFANKKGHLLDDEWNFYLRAKFGNNNDRAYGWFRFAGAIGETLTAITLFQEIDGVLTAVGTSVPYEEEIIEESASLTLRYKEYHARDDVHFTIDNIASARYDNIMEWYYRENIGSEIVEQNPGFDLGRIWFQRARLNDSTDNSVTSSDFPVDGDGSGGYGYMTMVVESQDTQTKTKWRKLSCKSEISQLSDGNRVLFETNPISQNDDVYYEIGRTYMIDDGLHLGHPNTDDISQTSSNAGQFTLPFFNCFIWGNGFESYKIKDGFNERSMKIDTRPSSTVDNYKENKRIAGINYGQPYEQTTGYNGLNEFNLSRINFKDLDDQYGSIQKLFGQDTHLLSFQEDKTHRIPNNKDILFDADGNGIMRQSNEVLGAEIAVPGIIGISKEPESFAVEGNRIYHTDSRRGTVMRYSADGYTVISNKGLRNWFRDVFRAVGNSKKIGGIDSRFGYYMLHIDDEKTSVIPVLNCGATIRKYETTEVFTYELNEADLPSSVYFNYEITGIVDIDINDNQTVYNFPGLTGVGNVNFLKTNGPQETIVITITPVEPSIASYSITTPCQVK